MKKLFLDPFLSIFYHQDKRYDINFFSTLIILLPIALITGPAIPDILISLTGFYFLVISIKYKLWNYYKNIFVFFFILFCVYSILRSVFSEFPIESLNTEGSFFYFRYLFFSIAIWYLVDKRPSLTKCLFIIIIICCTVVVLDGLFQYFIGKNLFGNPKSSNSRLTGLFGDEPIIGRYVSYMASFAFLLFYQNYNFDRKMTIISIFILVIAEVFIFLSGERAPLFYITFFSLLVLIFIPKFRIYRLLGFIITFFSIIIIMQINPTAKQRMVNVTLEQMSHTHFPLLPYSYLHEKHYVSALKMFKSSPYYGVGTNLFRYKCEEKNYQYKTLSCTAHPHNYYIQLLAELGIIGFLFLLIFFSFICYVISKQFIYLILNKKNRLISFDSLLIFLILFVYWWPLIPHMSFYNNWNNIFMMLPLGFLMKYLYSVRKNGIN
tara:strand:- start:24893 stop:26197 length:1305 start_codon:yes stop_codon:yes gene_type:complete